VDGIEGTVVGERERLGETCGKCPCCLFLPPRRGHMLWNTVKTWLRVGYFKESSYRLKAIPSTIPAQMATIYSSRDAYPSGTF